MSQEKEKEKQVNVNKKPKPEFPAEAAKVCLGFLSRTQISGQEAETMVALQRIMSEYVNG